MWNVPLVELCCRFHIFSMFRSCSCLTLRVTELETH